MNHMKKKLNNLPRIKLKNLKNLVFYRILVILILFFILLLVSFFKKSLQKKFFIFFYQCFLNSFVFDFHSLENKKIPFIFLFHNMKFFYFYFLILYIGIFCILIITPILFFNHSISIRPLKTNLIFFNIVQNIKNFFSLNIFLEFFKILFKNHFFLCISGYYLWNYYPDFMLFKKISLIFNIFLGLRVVNFYCIVMLSLIFGMAVIDFFLQRYQNNKNLRMTLQEVKNEFKELEGNPIIKQRIHYTIKNKNKKNNIFNADVIIMDQLKYAVAIKYDTETMSVPKILIKSQGESVKKLKNYLKKYQIPMLLLSDLTKVLYHNSVVGKDIPDFLYKPVAEVFAWVWQLQRWKKYGGVYPQAPQHISVPAELYFSGE
ncbi:type III protein export, membrane component [Buchnera aphidicola (Cinara tujafilina)]|uniref:Flagellar biosynthetic protein FlhB n=1 Tax=Buchnera aphidicola (Cinara tujafilina) TaxID=261317 RepID=F7WZ88_9GAMM|nr:type III protein export, membrane component [Buchnera aphidicola (Cinara tujafilina)]